MPDESWRSRQAGQRRAAAERRRQVEDYRAGIEARRAGAAADPAVAAVHASARAQLAALLPAPAEVTGAHRLDLDWPLPAGFTRRGLQRRGEPR